METLNERIKNLRKENNLTQLQLAEMLNVTDKAISKWEVGEANPDIGLLPKLAVIFNVTIDYLMTGKAPEKEIITMSKAELCAKNDDVSLAEEVKSLPKDENGKDIVDYILKYQSFNVFKKLCEIDSRFITRFKILDAITFAILSNSLSSLRGEAFRGVTFKGGNEIKSLFPVEEKNNFQNGLGILCILPRSFFTMIVTNKRINEETMDILLSPQEGKECVWYHAFPYMIEEAYKNNNNSLLEKLLDISKRNNNVIFKTEVGYNGYDFSYRHYFYVTERSGRNEYGIVRILESTIKLALEKGDFNLVNKFNEINSEITTFMHAADDRYSSKCYVASEDVIRVAKLKLDKSISEYELQVQSAIHNGILNIKELVNINDYSTIKSALFAYPIHPFEIFYKLYQEKNWKKLFEIAIDKDIKGLADALITNDNEKIEKSILEIWKNDGSTSNLKSLYINYPEIYIDRKEIRYGGKIYHAENSLTGVITYLNSVKQRLLDELSNKFNKDKIVSELTKEYFYSELKKGNREMVIIKLCVRMEAVLKCDYHYEGDFSEMLNRYCSGFNTYDDEGNDYDPYTPELLNKLRKQRNGIVHSEKSLPQLSDNEIQSCIEYICSL